MDTFLLQITRQNVQHHILTGNNQFRLFGFIRGQQCGMGVDIFHRPGGVFMAGPGIIGIHIILGKTDLTSDLIGMDLTPADQIVNGGFADMENVRNLLGGKGFVLCLRLPSYFSI